MPFERLRFFNFRNLKDRELSVDARVVFLVGPNGQGKTNLLEAVHLLCLGSSFREKRESALARDPAQATGLFATYRGTSGEPRTFSLQFGEGRRKEVRVDDKPLPDRRGLLAEVLCLCLVHEDMALIAGSPEDRRRFCDQTLAVSDPGYLEALRSYRQVLKARNLCLRDERDDLLDVYDAQLAVHGLYLQQKRAALVQEFDSQFCGLLSEVSDGTQEVHIAHAPSWEGLCSTEEVMARLSARRHRDRVVGITTSGPHRDVVRYLRDGKEYPPFASTGQMRLCALALRVAQARFLAAQTGRKPILLVDDVLLELDPARRAAFLQRFPSCEQVFFTFLPDESWQASRSEDTLVLEVEAGDFRRHGELL